MQACGSSTQCRQVSCMSGTQAKRLVARRQQAGTQAGPRTGTWQACLQAGERQAAHAGAACSAAGNVQVFARRGRLPPESQVIGGRRE